MLGLHVGFTALEVLRVVCSVCDSLFTLIFRLFFPLWKPKYMADRLQGMDISARNSIVVHFLHSWLANPCFPVSINYAEPKIGKF